LTSFPPRKGKDYSRDLRSRWRFAIHSRALVRKKAPRAATAGPVAVPGLVLHGARLPIAGLPRLPRHIGIQFETRRARFHLNLTAAACPWRHG